MPVFEIPRRSLWRHCNDPRSCAACFSNNVRLWLGAKLIKGNYQLFYHAPPFYWARWLAKLHAMFKAHDAKTWQGKFLIGFPVRICVLNFLFIYIFHDVVVRIESKCVIKAKHVLLLCELVRFCAGKIVLALKRIDKDNSTLLFSRHQFCYMNKVRFTVHVGKHLLVMTLSCFGNMI